MKNRITFATSSALPRRDFLRVAGAASAWTLAGGARLHLSAAEAGPERPWRAAVIGHTSRGDYGHGLESIFEKRPGVEVVALADPDSAGRSKVGTRIGAPRTYADYRELLTKERPALVSVAMRHADLHHDIVKAALEAGAHVYCEKPFVTSLTEADSILSMAQARGLRIAVAHTMRMTPAVVQLRQAVADGLIGEIAEVRAYGKQDARAGGEDMMVLGTHLFDLLRLFLGDPLSCAAQVRVGGRDVTPDDRRTVKDNVGWVAGDEVFARFAFPNGVSASFTSTGRLRETIGHWGLEFFGSKGVARINCDLAPNVFLRRTTSWTPEGRSDTWEPLDRLVTQSASAHNLGPVGDWLDAIARRREPECSGRNGAWAVEMVMAIYQAALSSRRVTFPLTARRHPLAPISS